MIEAASVNVVRLFPRFVISFVPEVYPTSNIFLFTNQKMMFAINQMIAPSGFPCCAIYPEIDPMIVGQRTHTSVSPTPANGPIRLVFNDCTVSFASMPSFSSIASVAPRIILDMTVVELK